MMHRDQIRGCLKVSDDLAFVSMQSDRYGYMPLSKDL